MEKEFTQQDRVKLQGEMWDKLEPVIEKLREENKINLVQYAIARDVLYDCTELHEDITPDNNIAQEFVNDPESFANKLMNGYNAMKEEFPDIDNWSYDEINDYSADYKDFAY